MKQVRPTRTGPTIKWNDHKRNDIQAQHKPPSLFAQHPDYTPPSLPFLSTEQI